MATNYQQQHHQNHHSKQPLEGMIADHEDYFEDFEENMDFDGNEEQKEEPIQISSKQSLNVGSTVAEIAAKVRDLDQAVDTARKKFAKTKIFKPFLILSIAVGVADAIVIAFGASSIFVQYILLSIGTLLMFLGIYLSALFVNDTIPFYEKLMMMIDIETKTELVCIILGWLLIFYDTGAAAIRCVRLFRFLWYIKRIVKEKPKGYIPGENLFSLTKASEVCVDYLYRIGSELFTEKSRAGVVVISMVFYISYILALMCWYKEPQFALEYGAPTECFHLSSCFLLMLRIALFTGPGFDFVTLTSDAGEPGYTVALFLFKITCATILYNGLIGIFSSTFVFEEPEKEEEEEEILLATDEVVLTSKDVNALIRKNKILLEEIQQIKKSMEYAIAQLRAEVRAHKEKRYVFVFNP